jgi:uncharacterized protein
VPRPIHFEIHAGDRSACRRSIARCLAGSSRPGPGPRTTGSSRLERRRSPGSTAASCGVAGPAPTVGQAVNAFVCTIDVPDIDVTLAAVPAAGGTVALPKMAVPGVGWLAYVKDPDGNLCGIMEADSTAQ